MIKPLLKISVITLTFLFTTSTFAEYYVVYPGSHASNCYVSSPCKVVKKKYKKYKKRYYKSHKVHKVYKKRSGGCMVKYRVYPKCNGAYWVPSCRYAWGAPPSQPCNTGCRDFYVPSEYYYRSHYYDSYYYDPAMDWDMRTMDDY
ncbi:MAG TPA: hypothetical protein VHM20_00095 [Gammaproteobacteria bacterium]|jgi:hypothetical protein|nr:hypothetical protein [Gammaproteobacteria bacterium]